MFGNSPLSGNALSGVAIPSTNTASTAVIAPINPSNYNVFDRTMYGVPLTNDRMDANWLNINDWMVEDTPTNIDVYPTLNLDFVNSNVLDPRITFTRASTATYYDGKTFALAEQNLFAYSNSFGAIGPNLIRNGTFDQDTDGWGTLNCSITSINGAIQVLCTTGGYPSAYQSFPTIVGSAYRVVYSVVSKLVGYFAVNKSDGPNWPFGPNRVVLNPYAGSAIFSATAKTTYMCLGGDSNTAIGNWFRYDNISVQQIEPSYANWTSTNCSMFANRSQDPFNTNSGYKLVPDSSTNIHNITYAISNTGIYTVSIYARAGEHNALTIGDSGSGSTGWVHFDLINGVYSSLGSGWSAATITSAGNGWYRCTATSTSRTITNIYFGAIAQYVASGANSPSFTGDSNSGIYIYGAQFEQRSVATAYVGTTGTVVQNYIPQLMTAAAGVPRFDYDPLGSGCRGLLVEEQRTNLFPYSSKFDNIYWDKIGVLITSNMTVSPDGNLITNAILLNGNGSDNGDIGGTIGIRKTTISVTALTPYVFSIYVKANTCTSINLVYDDAADVKACVKFNLSTLAVTKIIGNPTYSMFDVGDGWYRLYISFSTTSSTTARIGVQPSSGQLKGRILYLWGAQLEAGSSPTSYIPTIASQVTRSADSASMTGTNFSSWFNNQQGTFYCEGHGSVDAGDGCYFSVGSNTTTNRLTLTQSNNRVQFYTTPTSGQIYRSIPFNGAVIKFSCYWSVITSTSALSVAGSPTGTSVSMNVPDSSMLGIGYRAIYNDLYLNGHVKKIQYYPVALSGTQLQYLTGRV